MARRKTVYGKPRRVEFRRKGRRFEWKRRPGEGMQAFSRRIDRCEHVHCCVELESGRKPKLVVEGSAFADTMRGPTTREAIPPERKVDVLGDLGAKGLEVLQEAEQRAHEEMLKVFRGEEDP